MFNDNFYSLEKISSLYLKMKNSAFKDKIRNWILFEISLFYELKLLPDDRFIASIKLYYFLDDIKN